MSGQPRYRITVIDNAGDRIFVHRDDRHRSRFDAVRLRCSCSCTSCGTYLNAVRSLGLVDIPDDIRIEDATLSDEGAVTAAWSGDGDVGAFEAAWLRSR